jgi:hypothetical protein
MIGPIIHGNGVLSQMHKPAALTAISNARRKGLEMQRTSRRLFIKIGSIIKKGYFPHNFMRSRKIHSAVIKVASRADEGGFHPILLVLPAFTLSATAFEGSNRVATKIIPIAVLFNAALKICGKRCIF